MALPKPNFPLIPLESLTLEKTSNSHLNWDPIDECKSAPGLVISRHARLRDVQPKPNR
jgi:hypothetical protein